MMWLTSKTIGLQTRIQIQATYHKIISKAWELRIRIAFQLIQLGLFTRRRRWLHHGHCWCRRGWCWCCCCRRVVAVAGSIVKHQFGQTAWNIFTRRHNLFVCLLFNGCSKLFSKQTSPCVRASVCTYVCVCVFTAITVVRSLFLLPLSNLHDDDVKVPGPVSIFCCLQLYIIINRLNK